MSLRTNWRRKLLVSLNNMRKFNYFTLPRDINGEIKKLKTKQASYWEKKGNRTMLKLFKYVSSSVPAYKKLLKRHKINPSLIKTIKDFKTLPRITKDNYLRKYKYTDLFPKKEFFFATTFSATSGSTGEPFYFPRGKEHDQEYEYLTEIFLKNQFDIDKKSTLAVMGFALGIWIGGIFTYKVLDSISEKGYEFTIMPVGTNREQFLKAVKKFGHLYDQIILMGYPPFIKDVFDESKSYGINWKKYKIKILTAAEGYSERFRDHIAREAHINNKLNDIINMYGTVELGTMAHETALSNLIRSVAIKNRKVFDELFMDASNIPTLAQYYPHIIYFEEADGQIVASAYGSSIPLIRYHFSDLGGVILFDEMKKRLKNSGIDIMKEAKKNKIDKKILKLPFVWVYDRSDFAIVFRGANIYPGEVRNGLGNRNISRFVTGRFTMLRKEDRKLSQILEINVELKKNVKSAKKIAEKVKDAVINELCVNNSEFNNEYTSHPRRATPKIILHKYESPKYFSRQGKQKWVDK